MGSRTASLDPVAGELARTILEALKLRDQMRAAGASEDQLADGFERVIRSVWPFEREWKYLCGHCDDIGYLFEECPGDASCGRPREHGAHRLVRPCWCSLGARFKPKPKTEQDFTAATKSKPKTFTKWGRS